MPALDLQRLRRQTAELAALLNQPRVFHSALRLLLAETGNHTYRPGREVLAGAPLRGYHTPLPVRRAIAAALREPAAADPQAALAAADRLWRTRAFEEQVIAAQLLGMAAPRLPAEVLTRIENWLPDLDHQQITEALAREASCPLMHLDATRYLTDARRWGSSPHRWHRRFAVATLLPLAEDPEFADVPALFSVLKEVMDDPDPGVRKGAARVLLALSPRSPAEVRRFLKNMASKGGQHTARIIRRVLPGLAAESQTVLRALLQSASQASLPDERTPVGRDRMGEG